MLKWGAAMPKVTGVALCRGKPFKDMPNDCRAQKKDAKIKSGAHIEYFFEPTF